MLRAVADIVRRRGTEGWLVGGSVRDLQLGRFSPDLDVVVMDDPAGVARDIARTLDVPWFALSERHPAYRVMGREGHIDVAAVRGGGIVDDLGERDFTVNAMAVPIGSDVLAGSAPAAIPEDLIDPFGGVRHLREKRLVAVSDRVFADDPLRMMRAVRFGHVLGLSLDTELRASISSHASLISETAAERIGAELALTLAGGTTVQAIEDWERLGLLRVVVPKIPPDGVGAAKAVAARLDPILEAPARCFPEVGHVLAERLARPVDGALSRPVALRLATLTHSLSPDAAARAGRRLKLSGDAVSLLAAVSRLLGEGATFDWPAPVSPARPGRDAVLFMWRSAPWEPEVILMAAAVTAAGSGEAGLDERPPCMSGPARRLLGLWGDRAGGRRPPLPLDGDDLMRALDIPSGPRLGAILREVRLAWESGEIDSADEALAVARASSACAS